MNLSTLFTHFSPTVRRVTESLRRRRYGSYANELVIDRCLSQAFALQGLLWRHLEITPERDFRNVRDSCRRQGAAIIHALNQIDDAFSREKCDSSRQIARVRSQVPPVFLCVILAAICWRPALFVADATWKSAGI